MALVLFARGCHVLGQSFDVLLPDGRKVGLQFGQFTSRQKDILVTAQRAGAFPLSILYTLISILFISNL